MSFLEIDNLLSMYIAKRAPDWVVYKQWLAASRLSFSLIH